MTTNVVTEYTLDSAMLDASNELFEDIIKIAALPVAERQKAMQELEARKIARAKELVQARLDAEKAAKEKLDKARTDYRQKAGDLFREFWKSKPELARDLRKLATDDTLLANFTFVIEVDRSDTEKGIVLGEGYTSLYGKGAPRTRSSTQAPGGGAQAVKVKSPSGTVVEYKSLIEAYRVFKGDETLKNVSGDTIKRAINNADGWEIVE